MSVGGEVPVGSEVAGYRIERLVARGGMADVYRAYDDRLERSVAPTPGDATTAPGRRRVRGH